MLSGENIICVGFPKWDGDYMKSTVLLLSELARHNRILYVDYHYTFKDLFRPGRTPVRRLLGLRPRLEKRTLRGGHEIHLLTLPPAIPANWSKAPDIFDRLNSLNARGALGAIRRAAARLGIDRPVVINAFSPAQGNALAGQLGEKLLLYYCYDEISAAPWINRHGPRQEEQFLRRCDGVIVSSPQLLSSKAPFNERCFLVKNGVELALFDPEGAAPPPDSRRDGYQGTVGYLGSIDERLDFQLLEQLITGMPDRHFLFVGRITAPAEQRRLEAFPNTTFLGPRPPDRLADYIAAFDVALIPFRKNQLTAGIYPLKINEYLAMGKPVISTDFSDLSDFEEVVSITGDAGAYQRAVEKELARDDPRRREERRHFAGRNSWEARAREFGEAIEGLLAVSSSQPFSGPFLPLT